MSLFVLSLASERIAVFIEAVGAASAIAIVDYFAGAAALRRSKAA